VLCLGVQLAGQGFEQNSTKALADFFVGGLGLGEPQALSGQGAGVAGALAAQPVFQHLGQAGVEDGGSSRKIKGSHGYGLSFNGFQTQAMQKRGSAFKTRALTAYK